MIWWTKSPGLYEKHLGNLVEIHTNAPVDPFYIGQLVEYNPDEGIYLIGLNRSEIPEKDLDRNLSEQFYINLLVKIKKHQKTYHNKSDAVFLEFRGISLSIDNIISIGDVTDY